MPDCNSPKCHETMTLKIKDKVGWKEFNALKKCVEGKLTKKFVGVLAAMIGIPLFAVGAGIWAETKNLDEFVTHREIAPHLAEIKDCRTVTEMMQETLKDINEGQKENSRDIKEILRHLRDKKNE